MIGKSDGIFGYRVDRRKDGEGEPWIVITDYKGRDSEVHVPEKLDGISVKVLAKKAFLSKKNLKRVFLPEVWRKWAIGRSLTAHVWKAYGCRKRV